MEGLCVPCTAECNSCSLEDNRQCSASCMCSGRGTCAVVGTRNACACSTYHQGPTCDYVPPSHHCSSAGELECLSGVLHVGRGYDILRGAMTAAYVKRLDFAGKLFEGFEIPLQVTAFKESAMISSSSATSASSLRDYVRHRASEFDAEGQLEKSGSGGVSIFADASETQVVKSALEGHMSVSILQKMRLTASLSYQPDPLGAHNDPLFNQLVEALPSEYEATAYAGAVQHFGTHFVSAIGLGGEARSLLKHTSCTREDLSTTDITACAETEFQAQRTTVSANAKASACGAFSEASAESVDMSMTILSSDDRPPVPAGDWTAWEQEIDERPVPVQLRLSRISASVADPVKRANFETAIADYLVSRQVTNVNASDGYSCEHTSKSTSTMTVSSAHLAQLSISMLLRIICFHIFVL